MRLIKCKKCDTVICTEDTIIEDMIDELNEINKKALKDFKNKNVYIQQASQLKKLIQQTLHLNGQIQERKITVNCELSEITNYLINNSLISYNKLDELRDIARTKASVKNKEDGEKIRKLYSDFNNMCNRTKSDITANKAMRNFC